MSSMPPPRPSLWALLRAARVPQLLGVYAGVSFAVIQGGDIFVDRLGLPNWTFFGIFLLILTGVPVLVITALVQHSRRAEEGRVAEAELLARAAERGNPAGAESLPESAVTSPASSVPSDATRRLRAIFTWRNTGFAGIGAVGILTVLVAGFMALRALGIGPLGSLVAAGVLDREEAILIADFQSHTGDELLGLTATEAFRIDFEQNPLIRVVGPGTVRDALLRMQLEPDSPLTPSLARELALREGIKAYMAGEISPAGQGAMISVRLVSTESEETLVSFRESLAGPDDLLPAVERVSARLRERIGESLRSIRGGEPLARVSTASLPALRLYSQGVRALDLERDFPGGIALLEEAIALDSTFAMGWRKLGVGLLNGGYPRERWVEAFTRAYEHSDRLTDRERYLARAIYHAYVTEDEDRAIAAYRTVLDTYPGETTALNNLAGALARRGDRAGAAELYRRALALDSASVIYYTNLIGQLVAMGDWDEAEHLLGLYQARFRDMPGTRAFAATFHAARGDFDEAEALLRSVLDDPRAGLAARGMSEGNLANLSLIRGRLEEAARLAQANRGTRQRMGQTITPHEAAGYPLRLTLLVVGDTAGAIQGAEELVREMALGPADAAEGAHLEVAGFFTAATEAERARDFLREWDGLPLDEAVRERHREQRELLDHYLAHLEGRHDGLLEHLRRLQRDQGCAWCLEPQIGDAFFEAGLPDSAAVHYERYLEGPWLHRLDIDAIWLPRTLERLGQLYEARGDTEAARRHYRRFIELWDEADPPLQPRVQEARERLAVLGPG